MARSLSSRFCFNSSRCICLRVSSSSAARCRSSFTRIPWDAIKIAVNERMSRVTSTGEVGESDGTFADSAEITACSVASAVADIAERIASSALSRPTNSSQNFFKIHRRLNSPGLSTEIQFIGINNDCPADRIPFPKAVRF